MPYRVKQSWKQVIRGGDAKIAQTFGIDPLVARILLNRGLSDEEEIRKFLHGTLTDLEDPGQMDGIWEAAAMLHSCIASHRKIRIIGDYDADGILSTYILYHTLECAGAQVSYDVPDRVRDGFGMSLRLVEKAHQDGIDMLITCDNGIAQNKEIALAKQLGMAVIVTDHHEPNFAVEDGGQKRYMLPEADAIVDPKKPGDHYPNKHLCGAAVVWKLMYLFESRYMTDPQDEPSFLSVDGDGSGFLRPVEACPLSMAHLPFAAAATITDIMQLTGENRIIVKEGLKRLPETDNAGMRALIKSCGMEGKRINAGNVGYTIGPCLNAAGRLGSARDAVGLLLEKDPGRAMRMAERLSEMNSLRKLETEKGKTAALERIESTDLVHDMVLIVYLEGIHESIAGIIASKVKDAYNRPVIVFTDTEEATHLKGSGRSIEGYNLHEALSGISDMLVKFGGHPMAAGVTIQRDRLDEMRRRINESCKLTEADLTQDILLDAAPPLNYITHELVTQLQALEPFGPGMRAPQFGLSRARLLGMVILGAGRNCVKLTLTDGQCRMKALYFGDADEFIAYLDSKGGRSQTARLLLGRENDLTLTIAYRPEINVFRNEISVELKIAYFQ